MKKSKRKRERVKRRLGFTLIELLVVISIISLLSSVVLTSLNSARGKARDAKRLADKRQVITAMNFYYNDNSAWPPSNGGVGVWSCLTTNPNETCWNGSYTGWAPLSDGLQPYISSLPTNNADTGTSAYNRMMYISNGRANIDCGAGAPAGPCILWIQENTMTSSVCPGFFTQAGKYWYCYEYIGS